MKTIFTVPTMSCQHCEKSIREAIQKLDGVTQIVIDLTAKTVSVEHDTSVTKEMIVNAIDDVGFDVV